MQVYVVNWTLHDGNGENASVSVWRNFEDARQRAYTLCDDVRNVWLDDWEPETDKELPPFHVTECATDQGTEQLFLRVEHETTGDHFDAVVTVEQVR